VEEAGAAAMPDDEKYASVLNFTQRSEARHITGAAAPGPEEAIWSWARREPASICFSPPARLPGERRRGPLHGEEAEFQAAGWGRLNPETLLGLKVKSTGETKVVYDAGEPTVNEMVPLWRIGRTRRDNGTINSGVHTLSQTEKWYHFPGMGLW